MSILWAIGLLGALALVFGVLLGFAAVRFRVEGNPVVDQVDQILPQAQCGKCSFPGCRPYAEAVVQGEANINLCPPGGEGAMLAMAKLLDREPQPLEGEAEQAEGKAIAEIDEQRCIGCTLCIQACPVDAIVGSSKLMHTVIADQCTGCELCLAPCPVDCIAMQPVADQPATWKWPYPAHQASLPKAA